MKPTIVEPVSSTCCSLLFTALSTDPFRPELGFQSNNSERRLSTARGSVIKALLATSPLNKPHRGPSSLQEYLRRRIRPPAKPIDKSELKQSIPTPYC